MQTVKELLQESDCLKEKLSYFTRSLEEQNKMAERIKPTIIYNSYSFKHSTLTLLDVKHLLAHRLPLPNQSDKECQEILGHSNAFDFMLSFANQEELSLSKENICTMHQLIYENTCLESAGKLRTKPLDQATDGYTYPAFDELDHLMSHLSDQLNSSQYALHPIELAALFHKRLLDIHPFSYGNGIVARLLMNLILVHGGYGFAVIPLSEKEEYLNALSISRKLYNPDPITQVVAHCMIETAKELLQAK